MKLNIPNLYLLPGLPIKAANSKLPTTNTVTISMVSINKMKTL